MTDDERKAIVAHLRALADQIERGGDLAGLPNIPPRPRPMTTVVQPPLTAGERELQRVQTQERDRVARMKVADIQRRVRI